MNGDGEQERQRARCLQFSHGHWDLRLQSWVTELTREYFPEATQGPGLHGGPRVAVNRVHSSGLSYAYCMSFLQAKNQIEGGGEEKKKKKASVFQYSVFKIRGICFVCLFSLFIS